MTKELKAQCKEYAAYNRRGAKRIERILGTRPYNENGALSESGVVDLLTDIMHLCDMAGIDYLDAEKTATNHHIAETLQARTGLEQ